MYYIHIHTHVYYWNLVIKKSDITKPSYSKVILLVPALNNYIKSFIAKRVISNLVNLVNLRFKLLKYKENNKKIYNSSDHNFKNIPLYIMSNASFIEMYYFVLYDGALTFKMSKMALNAFCDKTLNNNNILHLYSA